MSHAASVSRDTDAAEHRCSQPEERRVRVHRGSLGYTHAHTHTRTRTRMLRAGRYCPHIPVAVPCDFSTGDLLPRPYTCAYTAVEGAVRCSAAP